MTQRAVRRSLTSERGSVLILSLVLVAIMTLLGLALFDLGSIEGQMMLTSASDARVLEIAQAGLERALERLLRTTLTEEAGGVRVSWANGETVGATTTAICSGGCLTTAYAVANAGYISNTSFNGGSYQIEFQLLTQDAAAANPYGQSCLVDETAPSPRPCDNLILVRSTGTFTGIPAGYARSRTLQALVKADSSAIFAGGVTAGAPGAGAINGNALIHGSIHIVGDPGFVAIQFGGSGGQRNSWEGLDATSLGLIKPLPLVCPQGLSCPTDANRVYSLSAKLVIAKPLNQAVDLSGGATLGTSADSAPYGTPSRAGKGKLDEVRIGDGCAMPCDTATGSFTSGSASKVFVDGGNITRPYPGNPPAFPLLTDPVTIGTTSYLHYACVQGSTCVGAPASQEFFVNHAGNVSSIAAISNSLGSAGGLTDATAEFNEKFSFTEKSGSPPTANRQGAICWKRTATAAAPVGTLPHPSAPGSLTLEFGITSNTNPALTAQEICATPATPQDPLLVYMPTGTPATTGFRVGRNGGPTAYEYRGAAIVVTNGYAALEETLQSCGTDACAGQTFPDNHMLGVLTTGRMDVGANTSGLDRLFGLFYTSGDFYSQKQTNVVGTLTAFRFCFGGASCPFSSGSNVPSFFQVPQDPRNLPKELFLGSGNRWSIGMVSGFWMECRRGLAGTGLTGLPTTPSGMCGYQQ